MNWIEARLKKGHGPSDLYQFLAKRPPAHAHHFWDEPWWPDAYVVRLRGVSLARAERCEAVDHAVKWDAGSDEELYGEYWTWVQQFFEAGSMLSLAPRHRSKLIHCFLNAQGMSVGGEAKWALGFAWKRITLRPRLYWRNLRR